MGADWVELFGLFMKQINELDIISNSQVHPNVAAELVKMAVTKKLQKGIDRTVESINVSVYHSAGEIDVAFNRAKALNLDEKLAKSYTNNVIDQRAIEKTGFKFKDLNYPLKNINPKDLVPIDKRFGAMTHDLGMLTLPIIERLESVWAVLQKIQEGVLRNFTGMLVPVPPGFNTYVMDQLTTYDDMSDVSKWMQQEKFFVAKASTILPKAFSGSQQELAPYIFEVDRMNVNPLAALSGFLQFSYIRFG
ncbi:hypothetical protein SPFM12_00066 [Salmonella phage SPFM12]|nr:hypothetical protein SPFM12_00066 [Salmonella phage SPFM12]